MTDLDMIRGVNADEPRAGKLPATARELLMATIAEEKTTPAPQRKHRKVRVASWTTAGVAAAAAAVVVLVGTSSAPSPTPTAPAPTQAAFVLNEAADHTIHQKDLPIHPGQYRYVSQRESYITAQLRERKTAFAFSWSAVFTTWVPYDQNDIWTKDTRRDGQPKVLFDNGATEDDKYGFHHLPPRGRETARCGDFYGVERTGHAVCDREFEHKQFDSAMAAKMPRDPHKLLTNEYLGTGPDSVLGRSALLLSSGLVPADLRAAIYRAIALVPGVQITDGFANLDGRKGIAFGLTSFGLREDIIIDPATGQYIGFRTLDNGTLGMPNGTVIYSSSMVMGVVDKAGEAPRH